MEVIGCSLIGALWILWGRKQIQELERLEAGASIVSSTELERLETGASGASGASPIDPEISM